MNFYEFWSCFGPKLHQVQHKHDCYSYDLYYIEFDYTNNVKAFNVITNNNYIDWLTLSMDK